MRRRGVTSVKDTKTHQMRRIALDDVTLELLAAHRVDYERDCAAIEVAPSTDTYVFSFAPDHTRPCDPDTITHRYVRMAADLGLRTHLHALRHYSATELLAGGIDIRTVAGRLGHAGGGATTLKVYAAWVASADRAAAGLIAAGLTRPTRLAD